MDNKQAQSLAALWNLQEGQYTSSILKVELACPKEQAKLFQSHIALLFGNATIYRSSSILVYKDKKGNAIETIQKSSYTIESSLELVTFRQQIKAFNYWLEALKIVFSIPNILVKIDQFTFSL